MHPASSWHSVSISRRRLLRTAAAGSAGLGAAALIGCTSSAKPPAATESKPGAAGTSAAGSSGQPRAGGTLRYAIQKDPDSLDPYRIANAVGGLIFASNVYSRLFSFEPGNGGPASGKIIGDLVASWEQPDPLTITMKLNPAAKFDQRDPLNGRVVTSDDVVQTWKRHAKEAGNRATLVNAVNPDAPVEVMEAIDASTVRMKLKFADPTVLPLLTDDFMIQPAEGIAGKIDLSKEPRGSGPFLFDSYKPSASLTYKRNPNWFQAPGQRPYVDGINILVIPDQAQFETQFRSKNLHMAAVSRQNIPPFAKELKGTEIAVGAPNKQGPAFSMSFLPGQPWHDVRVRRAVSMSIDRDAFAEVILNPKPLIDMGVKLKVRWNAPIAGGYGAYWLDPKSPAYGPAAQYLQHNVPEARKMLAAAGFTSAKPLEFDVVYAGIYYGTDYPSRAEALQSMMKDAGIKTNLVTTDYATEYIPKYFRSKALFKGKNVEAVVHFPPGGAQADPLLYYFNFLGSNGAASLVGTKFPELDEMERKQRTVTKFEDRVAGINDLQRWSVDNMIVIPVGPDTEMVDLIWKAVRGPQQYLPWTSWAQFGLSTNTYLLDKYWFDGQV